MIEFNFKSFALVAALAFFLGIIVEWKKPLQYKKLRNYIASSNLLLSNNKIDHDDKCVSLYTSNTNLQQHDELSVIVGHAYGNPKNKNYGLSPQLVIFLDQVNKGHINKIYFTGDVFDVPSRKKWKSLIETYDQVVVAAGNHDIGVGENTKKDIFFEYFQPYPLEEIYDDHIVLTFNTSSSNSSLSENDLSFLINRVKDNPNKVFFVLTHHILRPNPELISNFYDHNNPVTKKNNERLIESINLLNSYNNKIFFISGDTGGTLNQPRLNCYRNKNVIFISSGLGDVKEDIVLIKKGKNLFFTKIYE